MKPPPPATSARCVIELGSMEVSREIDPASQGYSRGPCPGDRPLTAWGTARGIRRRDPSAALPRAAYILTWTRPAVAISGKPSWIEGSGASFRLCRESTTGIFCRPSCPSRRPNPENVTFFEGPDAAQRAGYRACKRCGPDDPMHRATTTTGSCWPAGSSRSAAARCHWANWQRRRAGRHAASSGTSQRLDTHPAPMPAPCAQPGPQGDGSVVTEAMYQAGYGSSRAFYQRPAVGRRSPCLRGGMRNNPAVGRCPDPGRTNALVVAMTEACALSGWAIRQENLDYWQPSSPRGFGEDRLGGGRWPRSPRGRGCLLPLDVRATAFEAGSGQPSSGSRSARSGRNSAARRREVDAPKAVRAAARHRSKSGRDGHPRHRVVEGGRLTGRVPLGPADQGRVVGGRASALTSAADSDVLDASAVPAASRSR